jgi:hypothetical protein
MSRRSRPPGLFRGTELLRLLSAIMLLGLLATFYRHFRSTSLVEEAKSQNAALPVSPVTAWKETVLPISDSDGAEDSLEKDAFREEAQAIVDKKPYMAEEMASYWRLFRWARAESTDDLEKRARRDVYFTHLYQDPATFRGQLIHLRVHIRQILPQPDLGPNSANAKEVYQATVRTDESQSNPYMLVLTEKDPNLPVGADVHAEGTFVGFFHKLMTYEDREGTRRAAPVLIGRLRWMEDPIQKGLKEQESTTAWVFLGVFALIAIVLGSQWWYSRSQVVRAPESPVDEKAIDRWLETGEIPADPAETPDWTDAGLDDPEKRDSTPGGEPGRRPS